MSQKRSFLRIIIPILIVGIGAAIMMMLISTRPEPKQEKKTILGALVDVHILSKEDTSVMISGTGTVEPSQQITVVPQVSGLIVNVSPKFKAGGFFSKGETIFSIEDTDYLLALQKAEAGRTKAEYDVATIQSQAAVARQEWDILNK
nr:biotin/lipoyl-binding protein [bacterium]